MALNNDTSIAKINGRGTYMWCTQPCDFVAVLLFQSVTVS